MFMFLLVFALQSSPYPVLAVYGNYSEYKDCNSAVEYYKKKLPEEDRDKLFCLPVANPEKLQDI